MLLSGHVFCLQYVYVSFSFWHIFLNSLSWHWSSSLRARNVCLSSGLSPPGLNCLVEFSGETTWDLVGSFLSKGIVPYLRAFVQSPQYYFWLWFVWCCINLNEPNVIHRINLKNLVFCEETSIWKDEIPPGCPVSHVWWHHVMIKCVVKQWGFLWRCDQ